MAFGTAKADEGMWTLYNLPQAVYQQMQAEGFKLPYADIYQSKDAVKNAVVNFSGYCSGVVVSPNGLVFTNHHCGFEAIRRHSTVEHDYMLNGFYAKTYEEELPNSDMFVSFMKSQQDVTSRLMANGYATASKRQKDFLIDSLQTVLTDSVRKVDKTLRVSIDPFYESNSFYATVYQDFTDLRLVFTVPKSMGKLVVRQTTGCGRDRHAILPCSVSMPTQLPMDLPLILRTMYLIVRNIGHPSRSKAIKRAISP